MDYRVVIDEDGTINRFPILSEEEREDKHQRFLRIVDELIEKYSNDEKKGM